MHRQKRLSSTWIFYVLIAALSIVESATDIYVPSLPRVASDFDVPRETIGFTISSYFFAFCLMGPVYGPLSDALGRRRVLIFGFSLFSFFSLMCGLTVDAGALIACRFLQGVGASVAWILGLAIIKDLYGPKERIKMLSLMGTVVAVMPGFAPVIGGYVADSWGWRAIFFLIGGLAFCILWVLVGQLQETLPPSQRQILDVRVALYNYKRLLQSKRFLGFILISGLTFGGMMAYVSVAPFYFVRRFNIPLNFYGYFQMTIALFYMVGTYVNRRALEHWPSLTLLSFGLWLLFCGGGLLWSTLIFFPEFPWVLTASMAVYTFGAGIAFSNTSNQALDVLPEAGGASAALLTVCETICVATMVWIAGKMYHDTFIPVAGCVWICGTLCVCLLRSIRFFEGRM